MSSRIPSYTLTDQGAKVMLVVSLPELQDGRSLALNCPTGSPTARQPLVLEDDSGTYGRLAVQLPPAISEALGESEFKARFSKKRKELRVEFAKKNRDIPDSNGSSTSTSTSSDGGGCGGGGGEKDTPIASDVATASTKTGKEERSVPATASPPPPPPSFPWEMPPYQACASARPTNAHEELFALARQAIAGGRPGALQLFGDVIMEWTANRASASAAAKVGQLMGAAASSVAGGVQLADLFSRCFAKDPSIRSAFEEAFRGATLRRIAATQKKDSTADVARRTTDGRFGGTSESGGSKQESWQQPPRSYWTEERRRRGDPSGDVGKGGGGMVHQVGNAADPASLVLEHVINTGHLPEDDYDDQEMHDLRSDPPPADLGDSRGDGVGSRSSGVVAGAPTRVVDDNCAQVAGNATPSFAPEDTRRVAAVLLGEGDGDLSGTGALNVLGGLRNSAARGAALATTTDGFLSESTLRALRRAVFRHPKCGGNGGAAAADATDSEALGEGFVGTRGFICRFNSRAATAELLRPAGERKVGTTDDDDDDDDDATSERADRLLRHNRHVACLAPYFDAVRDPSCNAFVLNVLVCAPEEPGGRDGAGKSVDWHRDATLGLVPWAPEAGVRPQLAHQVNVLYLHVPRGMRGGTLQLRDHRRLPYRREKMERAASARECHDDEGDEEDEYDMLIKPAKNRMVAFRGDAEHCVSSFSLKKKNNNKTNSSADTSDPTDLPPPGLENCRISVVLEQYKVPVGSFDYTTEFEIVNPSDYLRSH